MTRNVAPARDGSMKAKGPAVRPRMVCTGCGMIGADARPNWREQQASGAIWR
jgi:hypothetical protein